MFWLHYSEFQAIEIKIEFYNNNLTKGINCQSEFVDWIYDLSCCLQWDLWVFSIISRTHAPKKNKKTTEKWCIAFISRAWMATATATATVDESVSSHILGEKFTRSYRTPNILIWVSCLSYKIGNENKNVCVSFTVHS